ncbi:MAG TPA: hypothetical protein VFE33_15610 [Thermoanaerobaculia bacterium]|nr:hypothetical protein [Thermoanaerobaculia bacterium]
MAKLIVCTVFAVVLFAQAGWAEEPVSTSFFADLTTASVPPPGGDSLAAGAATGLDQLHSLCC